MKSKFFKKNSTSSLTSKPNGHSYTQVSKENIKNIVKIKENFPKLSAQKVEKIHKVLNNTRKDKPRINITTKGLSRKQVIVPISSYNADRVIAKSNAHIVNINRLLKDIKSDVLADFMCSDNKDIIIMTNKIATASDLNIMEKYVKEVNNVNTKKFMSPRLPQLKSYLKILDISYFIEDTNLSITSNIVESIIKSTISLIILFWHLVLSYQSFS